jgi:hypothetical protein
MAALSRSRRLRGRRADHDWLQRLGSPILTQVGPMTFGEMLGVFDAQIVNGRYCAMKTRWLFELTPTVSVAAGSARTSPMSMIVLHRLRGTATRVSPTATAFGMRREHFMLEIIAAWDPVPTIMAARTGNGRISCGRSWHQKHCPVVMRTCWALAIGSDSAGTRMKYRQIADVKQRFDPDNLFSAMPLVMSVAKQGCPPRHGVRAHAMT